MTGLLSQSVTWMGSRSLRSMQIARSLAGRLEAYQSNQSAPEGYLQSFALKAHHLSPSLKLLCFPNRAQPPRRPIPTSVDRSARPPSAAASIQMTNSSGSSMVATSFSRGPTASSNTPSSTSSSSEASSLNR